MMAKHPYKSLPQHCFWRESVATPLAAEVDPVVQAKFTIVPTDKVVTSGSCFAQHIARRLQREGFNYFVTEAAHPLFSPALAEQYGYGVFSARYGNIYTSRQFVQTLQRAYGLFTPREQFWLGPDGRVIDPFRPQIQPNGFPSMAEFEADRVQHFAAIRRMVEECDVFVFTLGLTEGWFSREDGAAYPLCPGVAGGTFDSSKYEFLNLDVGEVISNLRWALHFLWSKSPKARVILTVSPVPLAATAIDQSVLVSATYSKSVLRVAADEIARQYNNVAYFPSYEIIVGSFNRGAYFAQDLRSVTETGVSHVMRLFMKYYGARPEQAAAPSTDARQNADVALQELVQQQAREMEAAAQVICDEEMLAQRG
jgi:hypothetical protein